MSAVITERPDFGFVKIFWGHSIVNNCYQGFTKHTWSFKVLQFKLFDEHTIQRSNQQLFSKRDQGTAANIVWTY